MIYVFFYTPAASHLSMFTILANLPLFSHIWPLWPLALLSPSVAMGQPVAPACSAAAGLGISSSGHILGYACRHLGAGRGAWQAPSSYNAPSMGAHERAAWEPVSPPMALLRHSNPARDPARGRACGGMSPCPPGRPKDRAGAGTLCGAPSVLQRTQSSTQCTLCITQSTWCNK